MAFRTKRYDLAILVDYPRRADGTPGSRPGWRDRNAWSGTPRAPARAGGSAREASTAPRRIPRPTSAPCGRARSHRRPRGSGRRTPRTRPPGGAVALPISRRRRARPPTARPPRRRCGARGSRPRVGEGRGLDGVRDAAGERQGLRPGGARHHDGFLAAHRAQEALELQLERLRFGGVEPHVLDDLLERGSADPLPPRPQPEEVPAPLRQVEGEIPRRLEDARSEERRVGKE